jgi:hypothetical protein
MKAVIFEKQGLDYLQVKGDVELPTITGYDVLIKVRSAGVNPIDYFTVSSAAGIKPLPHIPGAVCLAISGGCCMFVRHNICTIFILFDYRDRLCLNLDDTPIHKNIGPTLSE